MKKYVMVFGVVVGSLVLASVSSNGADTWASGTTGGLGASALNTYIVDTRAKLLAALDNRGKPNDAKIIYIKGKINLSADGSGRELTEADFAAGTGYSFAAYKAAFDPKVWELGKAIDDKQPLEAARRAAAAKQTAYIVARVGSNTSILGLGRSAGITRGAVVIRNAKNVLVRNIIFADAADLFPAWDPTDSYDSNTKTGGRWNSLYDNISVLDSQNVWVDHNTFTDGNNPDKRNPQDLIFGQIYQQHDGAVDVTRQSDKVTISYNHFQGHDKLMLIGGSDTATPANGLGFLSVSVHHNYFQDTMQRMPRVRFGKVHVFNNYYQASLVAGVASPFLYGIGIGQFAQIYSENNNFEIAGNIKPEQVVAVFNRAGDKKTYFFDSGSTLNNQAINLFDIANTLATAAKRPAIENTQSVWKPINTYPYTLESTAQTKISVIGKAGAGKLTMTYKPVIHAVVNKNFRGQNGDLLGAYRTYTTLQAALEAVPKNNTEAHRIFLKNGFYHEKLTIDKPFVQLLGESQDATILSFDAANSKKDPTGKDWGTSGSATLTIKAPEFKAHNITIENAFDYPTNLAKAATDSSKISSPQAVAVLLATGSDKAVFSQVTILGYQDTLYINAGRSYFSDSIIAGHVDFIFGAGQAVFENSDIITRARAGQTPTGYVTAPSTQIGNKYGLVFINSRLKKEAGVAANSTPLGRPWHPTVTLADGRYADPNAIGSSVFIDCWMDDHISQNGWDSMTGTAKDGGRITFQPQDARFFELNNIGLGAQTNPARRQLNSDQAKEYTLEKIFNGWNPLQ